LHIILNNTFICSHPKTFKVKLEIIKINIAATT